MAKNVLAEDSDGDAALLHIGGVLEAAISDGLKELRLEQHILEGGSVDTCVGSWFGSSGILLVLFNV